MINNKKYNIGLDIGVGSVGWCVTDEKNNNIKRNGKNMWGARIFEEAQTAKERREYRGAKRRLNRRKERINILQSLILEDMEKEYPNFFQMLRESYLIKEDKTISNKILGVKHNIFSDEGNTDEDYFKSYPTIYHLRKYLIEERNKVDIRLVYLAIHHIIKYRGNFLYEGEFREDSIQINENLDTVYEFLKEKYEINLKCEKEEVIEILNNKNISKSNKKDMLVSCFDFEKENKQVVINVINSLLGYVFEITKIFEVEIEKGKISFATEIENEEEIELSLQEDLEIYESMKSIYSWYILQYIRNGKEYISEAFIEKYNKYAKDLKTLKDIYKKYFKSEYNAMFKKEGTNNYVAYNGKNKGKMCKKCKPEEFLDTLKKKIAKLPDECEEKQGIIKQLEENNFLVKINVTDNGAIPHQLHEIELKKILENQAQYYKTLKENKQNIIELFSFRIPYYVGPLSKNQEGWSWVARKSDEKIRPWNFNKVIDEEETAEQFIKRMTNKCTYILNEDVIPKQSILYSKFCVLNELNNLKINNNSIPKDMKRKIIDNLFKTRKKVTIKELKQLYKLEAQPCDSITGLTEGNSFNSNMCAYIDMSKILGKVDESNIEMCEKLIYWITIFEEKKILKRKIKKEYKNLTQEQINKLCKLKYTGWSRLSKKLILGLKANDGETIIEKLEKTPLNFMQIINNKDFGFDKQLEELMPKTSKNIKYKDIYKIPTSPANKRAIWQTICVVKEITNIMGKEPENIFIEFARNEEEKRMKDNRAKQLLKKYDEIEKQLKYIKEYDHKVYKELKAHQSDKTITEKMYLYFIQNGKCLYSGEPLDIDKLNLYEVDHIIPQFYRKDDSIDNKALVIKRENQRKKDNLLLAEDIINSRREWWSSLLENGLITQSKFFKLTKTKMFETDNDREKFVARQLVETRQITKYVTNLLLNAYSKTNIFAIRAELTTLFRSKYKIYKNRNVNNYHHAHDAYILSVIGNILNKNWKSTEKFKYSEYVKKYYEDKNNQKEKFGIIGFVHKYVDINKVRETINYKDCYISRMLIEESGAFYNQTLYSPNYDKVKPVLALKEEMDVSKYGGYSGENKAYFVVYTYTNKKGEIEAQLVGIPVKVAYDIKAKKDTIEEYIKRTSLKDIAFSNLKIVKNHILKNQQYLDENNEPMRFCSDTEIRSDKELIVNSKMNELIYLMSLDEKELEDEQKEELENAYEYMFCYLLEKMEREYKVFKNIYNKAIEKQVTFSKMETNEKKATINGLINLMQTGQGNLKSIGLMDRAGRMSGKSFKTDKLKNMIFIDKSVTGMYERRYKIDGLENCCSK